jgi:cold shock CspA family protein
MIILAVRWFSNLKGYWFVNKNEYEGIDTIADFSVIRLRGDKNLNFDL